MQNHDAGSDGPEPFGSRAGEAEPATVAQAGRNAFDKSHLGCGEPAWRRGSMQAQVSPAARRGDQGGAQLVAES